MGEGKIVLSGPEIKHRLSEYSWPFNFSQCDHSVLYVLLSEDIKVVVDEVTNTNAVSDRLHSTRPYSHSVSHSDYTVHFVFNAVRWLTGRAMGLQTLLYKSRRFFVGNLSLTLSNCRKTRLVEPTWK